MASPGFYTQKFAKHDEKTGEGEGVPPPLKIFCGLSRMMGKSQKGGGIPPHPPSKNNGNQVIFLKEGGYLSLIGQSTYDTLPFFLYKTKPLGLPISFFTPSKQTSKEERKNKRKSSKMCTTRESSKYLD